MSPLLGILDSGKYRYLSNYVSIATATVTSGGQATITFSSIPSTYTHLQLRIYTISTAASSTTSTIALNSDTTNANYYVHYLYGNGSSASSGAVASSRTIGYQGDSTYPALQIIDILDYTNTNKYKVSRILTGDDRNGTGDIQLSSLLWMNTAAVNTIAITSSGSSSYNQYSQFALYGIK